MTAKDIERIIMERWRRLIWLPQFRIGVGYGPDADRTIDLWGIAADRSAMFERVAIEIKVTAGDFNRELSRPSKRSCIRLHCNRFYFAAPKGIIDPARVPADCGLLEVQDGQWPSVIEVKPCHFTETNRPTWRFVAALARRIAREESLMAKEQEAGHE